MAFQGMGQSLISATITQQRQLNWQTYQQLSANRIAVLQNDWQDQLTDWIKAHVNSDAWTQIYSTGYMLNIHSNVMRDIINKVAKLYTKPPDRTYTIGDTESEAYTELIEPITQKLNKIMDESLRFALACGGTVIRTGIDPHTGEFFFQNLQPDQFIPQPSPTDPTVLAGISYSVTDKSDLENYTQTIFTFSIIDTDEPWYTESDESGRVNVELRGTEYPWRGADGLPYMPVVYARLGNATNELVDMAMGMDLYNASIEAGWLEVQREWLTRQQSHKQLAIVGVAKSLSEMGNKAMDATIPVVIPLDKREGEIKTLDSISDTQRFTDQQLHIIQSEASKRGYSLSDFIASAQTQTYEAMAITLEQRKEFVDSLAMEYKISEKELALIMIKLNNNFGGTNIPEDGRFEIKYQRNRNYVLLTALGFTGESVINMGLRSAPQLLMEIDPNIESEDQAKDEIMDNIAINDEINPVVEEPLPPVNITGLSEN